MAYDIARAFSSPRLVKLFNEWMRRFTEAPETFAAEFKSVGQFLKEAEAGKEPSYGAHCVGYLGKLEDELNAPVARVVPAPPEPTTVRKSGTARLRKSAKRKR